MAQPQTLSQLLRARNESIRPNLEETNLETGTIYHFGEGTVYAAGYSSQYGYNMCWKSPDYGNAVIEMWGAGGSGARIACCGFSTPGNSGAYSKKAICVWPPGGLTSSTTFTAAGTGVSASGTYNGLSQKSTSGKGTGGVFNITKTTGTTYSTTITATVTLRADNGTTVGLGYAVGDTVVIDGASLGGVTSTNDLTLTIATSVNNGSYVTGCIGRSCNNPSTTCFRGCSDPSMLCWCVTTGCNGCMCSEGGMGGHGFCSSGTSAWNCYYWNGFCGTNREFACISCTYVGPNATACAQARKGCEDWYCNIYCQGALCYTCAVANNPSACGATGCTYMYNGCSYCGIICNVCVSSWQAKAYGGDVNCAGIPGCISFDNCTPNCYCFYKYHAPLPPGLYSTDGSMVVANMGEADEQQSGVSGQTQFSYFAVLGGLSKSPRQGASNPYCWTGSRGCGCWEWEGCKNIMPIGAGAPSTAICGDMCDHGMRGGHGAIRIKFY
jgi:hypothetical protein